MVTYAFRILLVSLFLSLTSSALPAPEPADATFNITAIETDLNQLIEAGVDIFEGFSGGAGTNLRRSSSTSMAEDGSTSTSGNFTSDEAIKQGLIELVGGEVQAADGFGEVIETILNRRSPAPEEQAAASINFTEITTGIEDVIQGLIGTDLGGGLKRRSDTPLTSIPMSKRTNINITAIEQEFQQFVQALEGIIGAFTGGGSGGGSLPTIPTLPAPFKRDSDSLGKFPEFDNGVAEVIDGALEVTAAALGY